MWLVLANQNALKFVYDIDSSVIFHRWATFSSLRQRRRRRRRCKRTSVSVVKRDIMNEAKSFHNKLKQNRGQIFSFKFVLLVVIVRQLMEASAATPTQTGGGGGGPERGGPSPWGQTVRSLLPDVWNLFSLGKNSIQAWNNARWSRRSFVLFSVAVLQWW